jgi:Zn-dependent protease with chaperone function
MAPLFVMVAFVPSGIIQTGLLQIKPDTTTTAPATLTTAPFTAPNLMALQPVGLITLSSASLVVPTVVSVTGILCIVGLFTAAIFGVFMVLTNDRVARRILHVIPLESQDYPWLQAKIAELSKKLVVPTPNVGLIEDLRPNAFIIGYGENATVVFSIGLLNILSQDEAAAVASHEITHIKNHDFFYKVVSSTLTMVSFFNPATYFVSSAAQREREMFADQGAIDILEKPAVFGDALAKIGNSLEVLSKESLRTSLSSNLFASSSVLHRVSILSTHPRLNKRLRIFPNPTQKLA